jgi:hypothetical protein
MKHLILTLAILTSSAAFAGPEEHINAQVCYELQLEEGQVPSKNVPDSVCVETLLIDLNTEEIEVYSYFQKQLVEDMTVTSLLRKNEDYYSFKSSKTLVNNWNAGCGDGENTVLFINGLTDNYGLADVNYLDIFVTSEVANDTCHSTPAKVVYKYIAR